MNFFFAATLPLLFWDAPPDTAPALREAHIARIGVPAAQTQSWKDVSGISVEAADPRGTTRLRAPAVNYRANQASATRSPWLDANGWQFLRHPQERFYYEVRGAQAALAAAEAFCYGGAALIHADTAGLQALGRMLEFLGGLGDGATPAVADIGFMDDGSAAAGEVMNMMVRDNLLFRVVPRTDPALKLTVRIGSKEFPLEEARNPATMAHEIRARLTDDRRSVRIYGSLVVVARLTASPEGLRVHLLNYAGAERKVDGVRVRVLGPYPKHRVAAEGSPGVELIDYTVEPGATEFTLPELKTYAVIDLAR